MTAWQDGPESRAGRIDWLRQMCAEARKAGTMSFELLLRIRDSLAQDPPPFTLDDLKATAEELDAWERQEVCDRVEISVTDFLKSRGTEFSTGGGKASEARALVEKYQLKPADFKVSQADWESFAGKFN